MAQSTHNEYLPGYKASQVIHHEWRTAENSAAYLLPTLRSLHEKNPAPSFLDVGAGSGTISVGFAKRLLPGGQVTVTDLSDEILKRAESFAAAADMTANNMVFRPANAYELPFPDATFDVTHCHQMLCHMDAPSDALREMLRVTKPGGVVAAREADMESQCLWPELPGLRLFNEVNEAVLRAAGACWSGGRQLVSWALKAGVRREQITASYGTWCFSAPEDKSVWATSMAERIRHGEMRKKGVEIGLITNDDQVEEMASAWQEWAQRDDASLGMMHGEIIIQK
ncbi:putative methylase involved in ubiquinone menaquinone biosynthesis protein [Eutypa lata UCREL1]|uniref:Putative methylase involved in ubiquinone menaquinone biosynthesis protein n=1 Tax=Eutypa lata (strain UCR-EL1) TaxID=1287681 RepID=M7ST03_EUTLA|nr:putative methylase involved in ubiquinone menaquinone biosynthesis protein [Eutypa lata UCREL1]